MSCGRTFGNQPISGCPECFAPLEIHYDLVAIQKKTGVSRATIAAGPHNIWRYADLLPIPAGFEPDLPVGFTPLIRAKNLGQRIGAGNLFIKNDSVCFPTLSFKDRVVSVALANAQAFGYTTVGCSSTGNLANSVAAQAARLGLQATILIPSDLRARQDPQHPGPSARDSSASMATTTTSIASPLSSRTSTTTAS